MIRQIALFELRYQLRQPLAWIMTGFFLLMTFAATASDSVQIGGAIGNIDRNAPSVILQLLGIMSGIGILLNVVFVAGAILRDFDCRTHELVFSRPVTRRDYLLGRFAGACLVSFTVFLGTVAGMILGSLMPWIDPESLGPFRFAPYLYALAVVAFPNLLVTGSVFFALASWSRSMLVTYLGVVGFFVAFFLSQLMLTDLDSRFFAALLDPFGQGAIEEATKYWTIVEKNSALPEIGGVLLWNRLLWLAVGVTVLAVAFARFRTSAERPGGWLWRPRLRRFRRRRAEGSSAAAALPETPPIRPAFSPPPAVARSFTLATQLRQFLYQTRLELASVFKGALFLILLAYGLFNLLVGLGFQERFVGTAVYPVTRLMIEGIEGSYAILLVIIITFYSGELIWKERSLKLDGVLDSMPTPNWVYLGGKLVAQLLVVVVFLAVGILATIGYQLANGYDRLELPVYAQGFVVMVLPFLLICFLASALQVGSGGKFLGYLLMILYLVSYDVLDALDFDHHLYRYGFSPDAPYSDMNGYGHFVAPLFWYNLYYLFGAAVLAGLAVLFWQRGTDRGWKTRLAVARQRFRGPVRLALPLALVALAVTGGFIFYNTNVVNEYLPDDAVEARRADYEKKFRQYKDVDLPRVTDVRVDVDIFPGERRVEARGRYLLENKNPEPLAELHVAIPPRVTVNALDFPPHRQKLEDEVHGYAIYELEEPLAPGAEIELRFDLTVDNPGFVNNGSDISIVRNGTFFNNRQYFPTFGYQRGVELRDKNLRRKYDLPPANRFPAVDDLHARRNTFFANDSDWIDFETTVSTSADQTAIAPGYLQRQWTEGGRRYFHYKMDAPILHFYSYLSADYTVKRDRHGDVSIEIYYHRPHDYNVERMIESIKRSLDYFSENFAPYQHRQMRIIEFPGYNSFAQAFPNTVPFSEAIGFIARLDDDEEAIDFPFYVTAHEVAHQWWAHQVIGGFVQGATMLSETMAQYSALMVMEKEYGAEKMRRFLKYELDRYLSDRSGELVEEMPLMLVENQPYIHYRKGSVVMYALRDYLGEEALNRAIADYTGEVRFQQPPFTHTPELLDFVRRAVPAERQGLIADFFEHITLYENRVEEARFAERADGKFVVTLEVRAKKVRADGQGVETEVGIDDWIDVGVFGEREVDGEREETVLFLEKRRVTGSEVTFELVVDERPVRAGIDPYNKLVDRNSGDNVQRVKETALADLTSP